MTDKQILRKEIQLSERVIKNRDKSKLPAFSFGEEYILNKKSSNALEDLVNFSQDWINNPKKYLNLDNYQLPKTTRTKNKISFPSISNEKDTANFYISFPPKLRTNKDTLAILLPHWGFKLNKATRGTNLIRYSLIPVSTAIYAPQHGSLDIDSMEDQYATLGPNLGLTLSYFIQDLLNLIYFIRYIRKEFKNIGIISFSLGNTRALPLSIFTNVDFLIMHLLSDNFANSVLNGTITTDIAKLIKENISSESLSRIWTPMNPGAYEKYFDQLPKHTRLVQGLFDLTLGIDNCKEISKKLKPYAQIEENKFGHLTIAELKNSFPMMKRNAEFVKETYIRQR